MPVSRALLIGSKLRRATKLFLHQAFLLMFFISSLLLACLIGSGLSLWDSSLERGVLGAPPPGCRQHYKQWKMRWRISHITWQMLAGWERQKCHSWKQAGRGNETNHKLSEILIQLAGEFFSFVLGKSFSELSFWAFFVVCSSALLTTF